MFCRLSAHDAIYTDGSFGVGDAQVAAVLVPLGSIALYTGFSGDMT